MGIAKPTGAYSEQMLEPGGWPEVDEDALYDRAVEYTQVLREVTDVLDTCRYQRNEIFGGGVWSGGAASAADGELGTNINELMTLQNGLATIITWDRYTAQSIEQAKSDITENVETAQQQISILESDSGLDAAERTTAINNVVATTLGANVSTMEGTAERILASKAWKPPPNALDDLLDQKTPPPLTLPDSTPQTPPVEEDRPRPVPEQPSTVPPAPAPPMTPAPSLPGMPTPGGGVGGGPQPTPAAPPATDRPPVPGAPAPGAPAPGAPGPATPGAPGGPGGGPSAPAVPLGPAAPAAPLGPAAAAQPTAGGGSKGMAPASATSSSTAARAEESSTTAAPAGATGMPAGPMAGGSGGASGGSRAGSAGRSAAPVGQKPPGGPPTMRPASAARTTPRAAAAAQVQSPDPAETADVVVPPPIIPVSAARAERDAIADAATADAARRGGTDPLQLARRIGAALNAPGSGGMANLNFFWVTAVTTDGSIVVANSYGVAYIPDGVQLPEQVHMASADDAIPADERARWATYPVMAVQGWANHHDKKLRAVIATEEQFAKSDPGAAKIVLTPEDIPDSGAMVGRSRLEVVDPSAAEQLAATSDARLVDLMPAAPAGAEPAGQHPTSEVVDPAGAAELAASVDAGTVDAQQLLTTLPAAPAEPSPPVDERPMLWFDVVKPLASKASGRSAAHLRAFRTYAAYAQEALLAEARTEVDLDVQRSAVADWLYWKRITALLDEALADAS